MAPIEFSNTKYTTVDRQMTFTFDFVQMPVGTWRVYIRDQPSYGGRDAGSITSHRLNDARGTFICWSAPIATLDAAKGVARAWADSTQEYVRTGRFPPPAARSDVPDWSSSARWEHSATPGRIGVDRPAAPTPVPVTRQPPPAHRPAPRQSTWLSRTLTSWRNLL